MWPRRRTSSWQQREGEGFTDLRLQHRDVGQRGDGNEYAHVFGMIKRAEPVDGSTLAALLITYPAYAR